MYQKNNCLFHTTRGTVKRLILLNPDLSIPGGDFLTHLDGTYEDAGGPRGVEMWRSRCVALLATRTVKEPRAATPQHGRPHVSSRLSKSVIYNLIEKPFRWRITANRDPT